MIPAGAALRRLTVQRRSGLPAPPRTKPLRTAPASRRRRAWIALLLLASALVALVTARLRVNLSASLPRGLYRLDPAWGRAALSPGDFVLACPPAAFARLARARGYLPPGPCPGGTQPLGKLVLALPGDHLDLGPAGIALDGTPLAATAAARADAAARPLPRLPPGPRLVAPDSLWLISPHPRSLDSRYFGPVATAQVRGRLLPLLTFGGCDPAPLAAAIRRAHQARHLPHPPPTPPRPPPELPEPRRASPPAPTPSPPPA